MATLVVRAAMAAMLASGFLPGRMAGADAPGDTARRIDALSRHFLGARYVLGPLGEEAPPDTDPRFRLDAFDCTTYIETVLALTLAGASSGGSDALSFDEPSTRRWLDRIRYTDGVPGFSSRRHLIESQWIPQLERDGLVRDVTRRIGGSATRTASLDLDRVAWEKSRLAIAGLPWSAVPHGRQSLDYLPWDAIGRDEVRAALPRVAILDVIATPTTSAPTLVIHQALLVRTEGGAWVARNASSSRGRVAEEPLDAFLHRFQVRRREVLGINVLAIAGADQ